MSRYTLQLKRVSLVPGVRGGNDVKVSLVTIYENGEYIKHVKLTEQMARVLTLNSIPISEADAKILLGEIE